MAATLPSPAVSRHLERLENVSRPQAKADLKKVEAAWRERVGAVVVRARDLAGLSQKEVSGLLGHADQSQINKWENGKERPQFDALFAIEQLRQPLVIALAELAGAGVDVQTVVTIRRRA